MSPSFEREYCLKYQGLIGNVFSQTSIDKATKMQYNPDNIIKEAQKSIGIDPGFGSSSFAIVATQLVNGKIQIIHAEEYDRDEAGFSDMVSEVWSLSHKCGHVDNFYVDAANPEIWQALKREFNEPFNEQYIVAVIKHTLNLLSIFSVHRIVHGHTSLAF
jgi:phage terminase large subunit